MTYEYFKLDDEAGAMHDIQDLINVKLRGDNLILELVGSNAICDEQGPGHRSRRGAITETIAHVQAVGAGHRIL